MEVEVRPTVGDPEIVFPDGYCGLKEFPDQAISLLGRSPHRFLLVAGTSTVLMSGERPETAHPVRTVFGPRGGRDFDNKYAGISSVFHDEAAGKLLGFYHAEDQHGLPRSPTNPDIPLGYWSVGLTVSEDGGDSFGDGVQILRSSARREDVQTDHRGVGDPCVVADATGEYLYAYYTDLTRRPGDLPARIGMARSRIDDGAAPHTWRKFRNGQFDQDGLDGDESGVVTCPAGLNGEVLQPHIVFLPRWGRYLMVCSVLSYEDQSQKRAERGGIFLCHSSDGIVWSDPSRLFVGLPHPHPGVEYVAHPTLYLDPENVSESEATGWLLYAHSPCFGWGDPPQQPHHLAGRPITLKLDP